MRKKRISFLLTLLAAPSLLFCADPMAGLLSDLRTAKEIDAVRKEELPFFYSFSMVGGYFNMPSARMPHMGMFGFGTSRPPPYNIYGVSFQPFSRIELSINYRVLKGITETNFGSLGFGDDADRIGNIKVALLKPEDGFSFVPAISIGADDFIGTSRFNSQYIVMTKEWMIPQLETTLGWGRGRMKGFFGGVAWSPWRKTPVFFLNGVSLVAEYDNINYKKHPHEHPHGRIVKSRFNGGLSYVCWDMLQLSVSSLRGTTVAGSASFRYPLGTSDGLLAKVQDPLFYSTPVDTEPLGVTRPEKEFVYELAYAFSDQGFDLCCAFLEDTPSGKSLWLKVINNRYREELVVRERIQDLLAALAPANIDSITVVTEADALPCQAYTYRTEDLKQLRAGLISTDEMFLISPMREATWPARDAVEIFKRNKDVWLFTFRPRLLTFFGSATGKLKYNVGLIASPEGYLFNNYYYKVQLAYSIHSTMWSLSDIDRLNPSQLRNVRTDTIRYYQNNSISLEKAFLQRSFNLSGGWFYRLAAGYFEPAYGGVATEFLYYPVNSSWGVGFEGAATLKRRYKGIAFTKKIRKLHGTTPEHIHFIGTQCFFDLYYTYQPLKLEFKAMAGQFLAKDWGGRFEVSRQFPSGLRLSLWYTITNGHDKVNGHTYYDKGFAFSIPLDFFLTKSSRSYIGYAMSAWLRDVGAIAETGRQLHYTLREERN